MSLSNHCESFSCPSRSGTSWGICRASAQTRTPKPKAGRPPARLPPQTQVGLLNKRARMDKKKRATGAGAQLVSSVRRRTVTASREKRCRAGRTESGPSFHHGICPRRGSAETADSQSIQAESVCGSLIFCYGAKHTLRNIQ